MISKPNPSPAEDDIAATQCIEEPGLAYVPLVESTCVTASPCAVIKSAPQRPSDVSCKTYYDTCTSMIRYIPEKSHHKDNNYQITE